MSSEFVYTALIDVLSYRNRLKKDVQAGTESFRDDLIQSLSIFDSVNTAIFSVQAISDTIVITCNNHGRFIEFLEILKNVFISFMVRGIYARGGIAYSKHFHSGRITYSHAIARAYEIESKEAIHPRIVLDKNILDMYKVAKGLPTIEGKDLLIEQNGVVFLNILSEKNWLDVFQMAKDIYENSTEDLKANEPAFVKHLWFENYLFSSRHRDKATNRYIPAPRPI